MRKRRAAPSTNQKRRLVHASRRYVTTATANNQQLKLTFRTFM